MHYIYRMSHNLYHLLGFIPATERFEMPPALEKLAEQLVRSGKLRINADSQRNFVRLGFGETDRTLTARELNDLTLKPATRKALARYVAPALGEAGYRDLWARLQSDLKKARGVSADKEMKIARVLVQSAHPAVIQQLIASGTKIFVSYSHNVGDLMAVHQWEKEGTASGLQATASEGTAVYVSAGGDPFFEGEQKHYVTDGFPALARMVVIAGQELGHFADLKRNVNGSAIGRHSTDSRHAQLRANPIARDGRLADMQRVAALARTYEKAGLKKLITVEKAVGFYHKRRRYTPPWWWYQTRRLIAWMRFVSRCKKSGIYQAFGLQPYHRHGDATAQFLMDMEFNLAPDAEVYRNPNPLVEEAIAVIEAVARVPQQVHKWGHDGVRLAWPNLYDFYYGTVIPAILSGIPSALAEQKLSNFQNVKAKLIRQKRPRPGYYPE